LEHWCAIVRLIRGFVDTSVSTCGDSRILAI
jgi:hypothetical protein